MGKAPATQTPITNPEQHHLWNQILSLIEKRVSRQIFDKWFRPAALLEVLEERLVIGVPNQFFKEWYEEHYSLFLEELAQEYFKRPMRLKVTVKADFSAEKRQSAQEADFMSLAEEALSAAETRPLRGGFNPRYTFEHFVVGSSNQFAHAASFSVAEKPSLTFNPLFIYGGTGLGKTHLLQAVGQRVMQANPSAKINYLTSEKFTNDLINAITYGSPNDFRSKYRSVDLLLIDDIQFIGGKERTQEEFFHTFNALHEAHKQIVITCDRLPKEIPSLEERLRSRFEWGLIADIQPPDLETRTAILKKKADSDGLVLPDEVAFYIASKIKSSIRELEGSLIRLFAYASLEGRTPNMELAQKVLTEMLSEEEKVVTIQQIQQVVADFYELKLQDLKSKDRSKDLAFPRHIAMFLSKAMTSASLPSIGRAFGGKDHTTVLHACRKISSRIEQDHTLRRTVENLKNIIIS